LAGALIQIRKKAACIGGLFVFDCPFSIAHNASASLGTSASVWIGDSLGKPFINSNNSFELTLD
jgi:hypothetical protein